MRGLYIDNFSAFINNSPPVVGDTPLGVRVFGDEYDAYCMDLMSVDEMSALPAFGGLDCPTFFEELIFMRCALDLNDNKSLKAHSQDAIVYIANQIFTVNPMKKGLDYHQYADAIIAYALESKKGKRVLIECVFKKAILSHFDNKSPFELN